jgi:hypothetical protein
LEATGSTESGVAAALCHRSPNLCRPCAKLQDCITDLSAKFAAILKEREKSIRKVIKLSDFDYIYNGFLQHSDSRFTARFRNEYTSGELNYVFIKNLSLLPYLKDALRWHHVILGTLTFPKLGPL